MITIPLTHRHQIEGFAVSPHIHHHVFMFYRSPPREHHYLKALQTVRRARMLLMLSSCALTLTRTLRYFLWIALLYALSTQIYQHAQKLFELSGLEFFASGLRMFFLLVLAVPLALTAASLIERLSMLLGTNLRLIQTQSQEHIHTESQRAQALRESYEASELQHTLSHQLPEPGAPSKSAPRL